MKGARCALTQLAASILDSFRNLTDSEWSSDMGKKRIEDKIWSGVESTHVVER